MKIKLRILLASLLVGTQLMASPFIWHSRSIPASLLVQGNHDKVVSAALDMFMNDISSVTGTTPTIADKEKNATIVLVQLDKAGEKMVQKLRTVGLPIDSIAGNPDAFAIKVVGKKMYAVGSNGRGTAYALLEISRTAGVSPWVWWGDNVPEKHSAVFVDEKYSTCQVPSVERRGIFINDEDWSILPWSHNTHDKADGYFKGSVKGRDLKRIGARTYEELFRLLLRLRANMIWPAMHEFTVPFYKVEGAMELADEYGIIVGTSHCEPMMRNNTTEWSHDERGAFNYLTNSDNVKDYWLSRVTETKESQNVYTIGMRGIHDGNMEGPKTLDEHTTWLQRVIDDQREMIAQNINPDVTKVPQAFVPYKEVLEIYENGLRVPDDVTLVWCDDNYGYLTRLPDDEQQKRSGGGGIYYHLSYWGRPHSYLWMTTTQPGLIYNEMREAYEHNVRKQWICNVHDPKVAAFDMEFFLNLAWDFNSVTSSTINDYTVKWFEREFGRDHAGYLAQIEWEYARLSSIRRPEFMGWNQIELDKNKYPRGMSPIQDTEFSFTELGGEAEKYITDYRMISRKYDIAESYVPAEKRDALFSAIGYRVKASAAFAEKMLEAQRARMLAQWGGAHGLEQSNASRERIKELDAEVKALTDRWNTMSGGKWNGLMDAAPQSLPVFGEVPVKGSGSGVAMSRSDGDAHAPYYALNAVDFVRSSSALTPVQQLGHSMNAVPLPKGEWLEYEVETDDAPESAVIVALIPTQANDKGDIRFTVSIDGGKPKLFSLKEPFRSERWKVNVLRQQARRTIECSLSKGKHVIRIDALDSHIVVDQLMVDTRQNRKFYVIPAQADK